MSFSRSCQIILVLHNHVQVLFSYPLMSFFYRPKTDEIWFTGLPDPTERGDGVVVAVCALAPRRYVHLLHCGSHERGGKAGGMYDDRLVGG